LLINAILDKEKHPKKKNTSLNTKFGKELNTILHVATEQGNILLVQTLLEYNLLSNYFQNNLQL